jgi:hypothetical protein
LACKPIAFGSASQLNQARMTVARRSDASAGLVAIGVAQQERVGSVPHRSDAFLSR